MSDSLPSIWQPLGPSVLLRMALFHPFYGCVIFHCIYTPHLLYLLICRWPIRWLPCLGYCRIVLQRTLGYMYLFKLWFYLDTCPGVGLQDHIIVLFLVFKGTSIPFSIVAIPIYISTNSVGEFPSLYILSSICLYTFWWWSFWPVWGDVKLKFWFAFLW